MSTPNLNVTELDFDRIKENLIEFFSQREDSPFRDWNFAGSGLNILIDALAYNTHYNAILAHMSVGESFIDSAQLRSSVVSLAKLLGYTPRSFVAPTAKIALSFSARDASSPETIVLPKGTTLSSIFNDRKFVFVLDDEHVIQKVSGRYDKNEIRVRQGSYQTKRIQVNNLQPKASITYEIDDEKIDVSTLVVKVFPTATSSVAEIYTQLEDVTTVNENSPIYFINENTNGNFEISFGNGVLGKKPNNKAIIELSYILTEGSEANGCSSFVFTDALPTGVVRTPIVATVSVAAGGSGKETIESVRYNAPLSFISQNRAVTADDYKNLIAKSFSEVETISVWGGENNDPPIYGKVFISIKPSGADVLTQTQRETILAYLNGKKVLSITPELVDPEYVKLTLDVFFKYNKNLISRNLGELENDIRTVVSQYNENRLQAFDGIFRYSALTNEIDRFHPAILNSHVRVFVSKSFSLDPFAIEKKRINFATRLIPDDDRVIISSSAIQIGGLDCYFGDKPSADPLRRTIFLYYFKNTVKTVLNDNVGTMNIDTGLLELNEIFPDVFTTVVLDLMPASNDIAPRRNQLLQIDMNRIFVRGEVDTVATGGSSRAIDYNTFKRDR